MRKIAIQGVKGSYHDIAAHKYFKQQRYILITTSVYSHLLYRWVPVLISFSREQTANNYAVHFHHFISRLVEGFKSEGIPFKDDYLAMVICNLPYSQLFC